MRRGMREDFTKKSFHGSAGHSTGATVRRMTFSIRTKKERCKTICTLPHQVAFHQSHARIGGKTRGQRQQFGIQNVKHHIESHELGLLRHDWIGFVARQHIFALNHKGIETFGKFVNVTSTSLKCHLYQQPEDGVDWAKEF
ncbi:hypothetical protein TNCV_848771 [Trichonephila clavipes]|uniref:Uncharacterized protein n=1 Tax=Trichonephila clavipes TaxID=2585209 RepID=A0A8X6RM82_TRICX|nr:hypothetical protein TNCV_848771 [Trichonephila clavipes]